DPDGDGAGQPECGLHRRKRETRRTVMNPAGTDAADDTAVLAALANGIIPADARDAGAAAVAAGPRLAEKLAAGVNAAVYRRGLAAATELARTKYGRDVTELDATQTHELLGALREQQPGFFKQLRM